MAESQEAPDKLIKIIFVGDSGVGKTCLIERMFSNRFDASLPSTIGTDQRFKRLNVDGVSVGVSVWDTAGQERFQSLTSMFFRGAQGVVYVYDVTRPETLNNLATKWMDEFRAHASHPDAVQMVVGNKTDLGVRGVSSEDGAAFARAHGCLFKETSAKTDSGGVDEGVYDALIWGLVCTILDTPGLTRRGGSGAGGGNLDLQAQRGLRKWLGGCC